MHRLPREGKETGELLRRTATDLGADLIVMGGFGHSRLRERIFGGTTTEHDEGGDGPGADGALSARRGVLARRRQRAMACRRQSAPRLRCRDGCGGLVRSSWDVGREGTAGPRERGGTEPCRTISTRCPIRATR